MNEIKQSLDAKQSLPDLSHEECEQQLRTAFSSQIAPNQADITGIISRLKDPRLYLWKSLPANQEKRKLALKSIAKALKNNTICKELFCDHLSLDDDDTVILAKLFKSNRSIESLDLSHNKIGDKGIQALANMLKTNNTLKKIDLKSNQFTVIGAKNLAEVILNLENTTLTSCSIHYDELIGIFSKTSTIAGYHNQITEHLDYFIATGQVGRYATVVNQKINEQLPPVLANIVLAYSGLDKPLLAEQKKNPDAKYTENSLGKICGFVTKSFMVAVCLNLLPIFYISWQFSEDEGNKLLRAGTGNSACPNVVTIFLVSLGISLTSCLLYLYWQHRKKENYTIPPIDEDPIAPRQVLNSLSPN